jgi:hypothetical protein
MLRPIQQGIQSQHITHELFNKYVDEKNTGGQYFRHGFSTLMDWSRNHKTAIVLNGGVTQDLQDLHVFLDFWVAAIEKEINMPLPWASFNEDEYSMGGLMTGVGIVLPECIYDAVNYKTALMNDNFSKEYFSPGFEDSWFYFPKLESSSWYQNGNWIRYTGDSAVGQFLKIMKKCQLAA